LLTLLTATGCRPDAWAICEKLMYRQTYQGPVRWIIVDDGEVPQPVTFSREGWQLDIIRPKPFWTEGQNTQARNLLAGMAEVGPRDLLVIIEDDDYYSAEYLTDVAKWLCHYDLVGEPEARYFNVSTGVGKQLPNKRHSSLCSTAMKGLAIHAFGRSVRHNHKFIDLALWRDFRGKKYLSSTHHVVGVKGLPGRLGIGAGHRMQGKPNGQILREWIGNDAGIYGY